MQIRISLTINELSLPIAPAGDLPPTACPLETIPIMI
jgi:hypothetical protein